MTPETSKGGCLTAQKVNGAQEIEVYIFYQPSTILGHCGAEGCGSHLQGKIFNILPLETGVNIQVILKRYNRKMEENVDGNICSRCGGYSGTSNTQCVRVAEAKIIIDEEIYDDFDFLHEGKSKVVCPVCTESATIDDIVEFGKEELQSDEKLCEKHEEELLLRYNQISADEATEGDMHSDGGLIGDIQEIQRRNEFDGTGQDEELECEGLGY